MLLNFCQRQYCGGWMKEIINPKGKMELICGKCAWPPDAEIEKVTKRGKEKFIEFDQMFRAIRCKQESDRRKQIKLKRVHI